MLSGLHVRKDHQRYAIFVALDDNDTSNEGINREIDRDYLCVLFYDFLRMILVTKSFLVHYHLNWNTTRYEDFIFSIIKL